MKPPKRLRVGYRHYQIHPWSLQDMERNEQWGECDKTRGEIFVCTESDPLVVLDTLLHELFHAIWNEYNVGKDSEEEPTVHMLAAGLTQVLYDNPQLLKFCGTAIRKAQE